jgi:hypothetical protein
MTDDLTTTPTFDPTRHLTRVNGKDYLPVAFRIAWLRDDAPDSLIETEIVRYDEREAVVKATITRIIDGEVRGRSTDYGSETPADFGDYFEKAITKAIGRAAASLGYGTQFTHEFDFGGVVDSPVARREQRPQSRDDHPPYEPQDEQRVPTGAMNGGRDELATAGQMGAIYAISKNDLGWDKQRQGDEQYAVIGIRDIGWKEAPKITRVQAKEYIEHLNAVKSGTA